MNFYALYRGGELVAHCLADSAVRAAWLAAGPKGDAGGFVVHRIAAPDEQLQRAAAARHWREGVLDLSAAACGACEGAAS